MDSSFREIPWWEIEENLVCLFVSLFLVALFSTAFIIIYVKSHPDSKFSRAIHRFANVLLIIIGILAIPVIVYLFSIPYFIASLLVLLSYIVCRVVYAFRRPAQPVKISIPVHADSSAQSSPPVKIERTAYKATENPVPDTRSFDACKFIWDRSLLLLEKILPAADLKAKTYVWTAIFYAVTKHVRKQSIVDDIFSSFPESILSVFQTHDNPEFTLLNVKSHYWKFRSILNTSGIDPRTDEGLLSLWSLTLANVDPHLVASDSMMGFAYDVKIIVRKVTYMYHLSHQEETHYLMEAANGMLIQVPESKLESWEAAQYELCKNPTSNPSGLTPEQKEYIKKRILDDIYGLKEK